MADRTFDVIVLGAGPVRPQPPSPPVQGLRWRSWNESWWASVIVLVRLWSVWQYLGRGGIPRRGPMAGRRPTDVELHPPYGPMAAVIAVGSLVVEARATDAHRLLER